MSDEIHAEFIRPPYELGHQYRLWQGFALRAIAPSVAFSLASGSCIWAAVNGEWWLMCAMLVPVVLTGGVLLGLKFAFDAEINYATIIVNHYSLNLASYRVYVGSVVNVRAGKGSTVNVNPSPEPAADTSPAETRAKFVRHLREFKRLIPARGIQRKMWLPVGRVVQWEDGEDVTRDEYDQICALLKDLGEVQGRKRGASGTPLLAESGAGE